MATINRSSIVQNTANELLIQSNDNSINKISETAVPTYSINHKYSNIVKSGTSTATGTGIIYTTVANKEFYLTGLSLSITKDIVSDAVYIYITAVIDGASQTLVRIGQQTLTASSETKTISFPYPIKIDQNTNISVVKAHTAGTNLYAWSIMGIQVQ